MTESSAKRRGELSRDDAHFERVGGLPVEPLEIAVGEREQPQHVVRGAQLQAKPGFKRTLGILPVAQQLALVGIPCLGLRTWWRMAFALGYKYGSSRTTRSASAWGVFCDATSASERCRSNAHIRVPYPAAADHEHRDDDDQPLLAPERLVRRAHPHRNLRERDERRGCEEAQGDGNIGLGDSNGDLTEHDERTNDWPDEPPTD